MKATKFPIVLSPLQFSNLALFDPRDGKLTQESDRPKIIALMESLCWKESVVDIGYTDLGNGKGLKKLSDGSIEVGFFVNGSIVKGRKEYACGHIYDGEFQCEKRHGRGRMTYYGGEVLYANYENDALNSKDKRAVVSFRTGTTPELTELDREFEEFLDSPIELPSALSSSACTLSELPRASSNGPSPSPPPQSPSPPPPPPSDIYACDGETRVEPVGPVEPG